MARAQEYLELGNNCANVGEWERAREYYQKSVELEPKWALAWCNLGVIKFKLGITGAEEALLKAVELEPEYSLGWYNLAQMSEKLERREEAVKYYYEAIRWDPAQVGMYNELALTLKHLNRLEEVVEVFLKALAIEPSAPILYNNLGNVYRVLGRFNEAKAQYMLALSLDPKYANAWGNLGVIYKILGELTLAREALQKGIAVNPNQWDFYHNLGVVGQEEGRIGEAIVNFEKSIELNPSYEGSYPCLYLSKRQICDWAGLSEAEAKLDQITDEDPFTTIIRSEDLVVNYRVAKARSEAIERVARRKSYQFDRRAHKKIRLGYFSTDFREHPIGQMSAPLFELHDRERFEVYAYSYGRDDGSEWRRRVEARADVFVEAREMANPELAERIVADEIDILIDLTGYTMDNRLEVAAARVAPIQVTWLGYPGTSGATWFDYLIADPNLIKKGEEKYFSEKIVYLPTVYQINDPAIIPESKKESRADWGLPQKGMVIAVFNQVYKIEPELFEVWMRILKAVPGSVLWFWRQDKEAEENLSAEAVVRGVDPKRLVWAERVSKREHLTRLKLADLSLDTTVYGGHTTTTDSLIAGVPVVTRDGVHFASRVSSSILRSVGLNTTIAKTILEYEKIAIELLTHPKKIKALKDKLTRSNLTSELINPQKTVKLLEQGYQKMYDRWKQMQEPTEIRL